jgi:hypothetical protein
MLKRFFFFRRIRVRYFHQGKRLKSGKLSNDILLKSIYDLRYPEFISKYLSMQYARIGGELHVHEDRVKIYDASGKELNL